MTPVEDTQDKLRYVLKTISNLEIINEACPRDYLFNTLRYAIKALTYLTDELEKELDYLDNVERIPNDR